MNKYNDSEQKLLIALGLRLKKYRLQNNFSQEELAEKSSLHRTYIGSIERGERNISIINLYQLSSALEISISLLLEDTK